MSMQEDVRSAVPRTVTPGSRRSSRSHERTRQEVDEVVVQGASSRVKTLPKNLIARAPCKAFSEQRGNGRKQLREKGEVS
jgi:hypothetical protein